MSSKTTVTHFAKLNDLNYPEWSVIMEAELVWRGLWSVVMVKIDKSGKDKMMIEAELKVKKSKWDEEKMTEAWAEMILRVEGGQLSHMQSCDPLEIWQDLQHVHHAYGFTTSLALHRQSFMTKKTMWSILVCKLLIETRWQVCWEIRLTSSKTAITSLVAQSRLLLLYFLVLGHLSVSVAALQHHGAAVCLFSGLSTSRLTIKVLEVLISKEGRKLSRDNLPGVWLFVRSIGLQDKVNTGVFYCSTSL